MKEYRLRTDLQRVMIDDFALPLGIAPAPGSMQPPVQGYTVTFTQGDEDEPDTYSFHVVVSHERLSALLHRALQMLPELVFGIIEIGSRDAYRSTDIYISQDPLTSEHFMEVWDRYEAFFLEDSSIAAGANSEEPFVEVFLDQWKGVSIHVPTDMRDQVEAMLDEFSLQEVAQTWPTSQAPDDDPFTETTHVRPVLDLTDEYAPDVDEVLLNLRHEWRLDLNIDRETNIDEGGRNLGSTLWHAVVIVDRSDGERADEGAYASVWATASSLAEMETLIEGALQDHPQWAFGEIYTIDRVAYDERPDELAELPPRRASGVHLVTFESWGATPPASPPGGPPAAGGGGSPPERSPKSPRSPKSK